MRQLRADRAGQVVLDLPDRHPARIQADDHVVQTPPDAAAQRTVGPWSALLLAGAFEVGYALSVKGSRGFTDLTWSLAALVFFLCTLFFLSVALKRIDVGIGYAVWAGIGAVGSAVLGPVFFDETFPAAKAVWLVVIIAGVIWLKPADRAKLDHR